MTSREREIEELLKGYEMPKTSEKFAGALEAQLAEVKTGRRGWLAAAGVAAAAVVVVGFVLAGPAEETKPPPKGTGLELARRGEYEAALKVLAKEGDHLNRGVVFARMGQFEPALGECERALELDPTNVDAWVNRGWIFLEMGRLEAALECFARALRIVPHHPGALAGKAAVLHALGRNEDAHKLYQHLDRMGQKPARGPQFVEPPGRSR